MLGWFGGVLVVVKVRELGLAEAREPGTVDSIVGLGLLSDYLWEGEDLVEALRRRSLHVSD